MSCPNVNSQAWRDLVNAVGVREAYREFLKYGEIPDVGAYPQSFAGVNATLKVVGALNSDKMQQVYSKFYEANPDKFYAELLNNGETKAQVQLLREWNTKNRPQSLEDMIAGIAAEMSYTVEINVTTTTFDPGGSDNEDYYVQQQQGETPEELEQRLGPLPNPENIKTVPTSHYSSMTVPGGTNYRENEIRTPEIVPSIKGHAAFSSKSGIGWFRSDDKVEGGKFARYLPDNIETPDDLANVEDLVKDTRGGQVTKARRILELQSDLFQKGRVSFDEKSQQWKAKGRLFDTQEQAEVAANNLVEVNDKQGYLRASGEINRENDFLKLMRDNNNWVTFFVKSIIQDSVRKGYEEVLFPVGNTAAKVEGHETLENHISRIRHNIADYEEKVKDSSLEAHFKQQISGIEKHTRDMQSQAIEDKTLSEGGNDIFINPKVVGSDKDFVRIRDNKWDKGTGDLVGDPNYNGLVLYEYTVGRGNNIRKITREEAQELLSKDNAIQRKALEDQIEDNNRRLQKLKSEEVQYKAQLKAEYQNSLDTYKAQLDAALSEGLAAIAPIASFYENTIHNILQKQQYAPERITDEYGNDWFKVPLRREYEDTIYFYKGTANDFQKTVTSFLQGKGYIDENGNVIAGDSTVSENVEAIGRINQEYYNEKGFFPISVEQVGNVYKVSVNDEGLAFSRDIQEAENTKTRTLAILGKLKENTGIDYEIVDAPRAQELLGKQFTEYTRAFFKDGKVYMLDGTMTPSTAFHEYAHPFVFALRKQNLHLWARLAGELQAAPETKHILEHMAKYYPELTAAVNTNDYATWNKYSDEIVVRAMEGVANGTFEFVSEKGMGFWSKLWFGIKQMFRQIFGQKVDLSKLSPNTSLAELSNMLLTEKMDLTPSREQEDYALFNRDIAKEMTNIPEHQSMKAIETFHRVTQDHLIKLRENKNYNELREVLKNQADGSILNDLNKLLNLAKQKEEELDNNMKQLTNFSRAVVGAGIISDKMKTHVLEMSAKDMDERDKLRIMRYYSFISNDWLQAFEQLREANSTDLPLLGAEIQRATSNFQRINDHIAKAFKGGLVKTFMDNLEPINENMEKELKPELDRVRGLVEGGNKSLQNRLDYLQKMYDHGRFDEEKVLKLLQGELGDTNFFSSLLESYTSSPDPIVGGFAAFVNKELYKVEGGMQDINTRMGNELAPLYKEYGVDISRPEQLGQQLVFKDIAFTKDENGDPKGHEVYTFLHEFGGGHQFDYQNLQHKIDAAKEGGNKQEAIKLQKEFDQLKKDYFHREYVDEVYAAKEFWNESDINRLAQQRRKDITDQLSGYEAEASMSEKGLTVDDRDHIDQLLRELKTLSSTKNLDGTDKTGEDLGVAQAIQEYNKRMMRYREEMAMKGAFERDMQTAKDDILDKGMAEGSSEYSKALNAWLKENIRVRLSDKFYEDRDKITDAIAAIVNKLDQDEAKKLDVSKSWKEMFEQVKGFRDQDNQPIGTSLSEDKIRHVKSLQEKINSMVEELRRISGLTSAEADTYSQLWAKMRAGLTLDTNEAQEFAEIMGKKQINGLSKDDKVKLFSLFEQLKEFQSKIPTEYYIEAFNKKLKESGMQENMGMDTAEPFLDPTVIDPFLEESGNTPFAKWFLENHVKRVKWNATTSQHQEMYERLYIWSRIVPNDAGFKNALATNNYHALLSINNPYVNVRPAAKYFFYRIKNEYRTKREVGKTIDNKGNWLPKTVAQGAKDDKYISKQYTTLRNSKDSKQQALYKILEIYKRYHLQVQEDAPRYARLWYELPRVRKERIENLEALLEQPLRSGKNLISWIGSLVGKSKPDAFDNSVASKRDLKNEQKMYVATDLFGNEINSIPMRYMSKLDADTVSLDVGRSSIKYALALQINKTLHDINPFAQALQQTLAKEGIKSINKASTRNWASKFTNIPVLSRNNNRLKAINNMVERDIEGIENHMELGLIGSKVAQHLMGVAAFGSLALNLPAGIKNVVVAKFQNLTEAVSKEFFTPKNLKEADQIFMKRFMPKLIHDYNKFAGRSLETQIFELFDFVQGKFEEHVGESYSASVKKDIARLRFTRSFQVLGELQAQGQAGIAMMIKQQVPWLHEGKSTMINYLDAWEMRDGVIQLKEGVDKSWDKTGNNFATFKLKVHKINELMQGAYAKMNQAEASRYTSFKLLNFMRRYLVPGIANRFTVNRNNFALGTQREGYYTTFLRMAKELPRDGIKNWAHYTEKEKRNAFKMLTEMGYSMAFMALISMMGYNSNDPDKNKKLKGNSWAFNMALYEIVMIKGELENFIPFPGMGMNEILRMKDQPSIAFPLLNKYYKIISHLIDAIQQPFTDYDITHYRRSTGIYKKGDLKLWADLLKAIGYTGATTHPDVAVKNYMATTNRYN